MKEIVMGVLLAALAAVEGQRVTIDLLSGAKVSGTLTRIAADGVVITTTNGVEKIKFTQMAPGAVEQYRDQANAQGASEMDQIRAELDRLRAENAQLRARLDAMAGPIIVPMEGTPAQMSEPPPQMPVAPPQMPVAPPRSNFVQPGETPTVIRAKLQIVEGQQLPEARKRLERLERLHGAKYDMERSNVAAYYDGRRDTLGIDVNAKKRLQEIKSAQDVVGALEAEVERLKALLGQ